jgi:hypothetical protein
LNIVVPYEGEATVGKCSDAAIQRAEMETLQIRRVAREMNAKNLPSAARGNFEGVCKPFDDECTPRNGVPFARNVLIGFELDNLNWQGLEVLLAGFRQWVHSVEPSCDLGSSLRGANGHPALPMREGRKRPTVRAPALKSGKSLIFNQEPPAVTLTKLSAKYRSSAEPSDRTALFNR